MNAVFYLNRCMLYFICRIRKGFPSEARVVSRVLPALLLDFFPAPEVMNKVIGEFLSSQQPHPELMAEVIFKASLHLVPFKAPLGANSIEF